MTTQLNLEAVNTTKQGRPLSEKGKKVANAVVNYINKTEETQFSAKDIAKKTKTNKASVRNRLHAIENKGLIVKTGTKDAEGRGRPETLYSVVEQVNPINEATKANREFLREICAMGRQDRMHRVGGALMGLYENQLEDERKTKVSHYINYSGFTKYDAKRGTEDALYYAEHGMLTTAQVNYWLATTNNTYRTRIGKYHRQVEV